MLPITVVGPLFYIHSSTGTKLEPAKITIIVTYKWNPPVIDLSRTLIHSLPRACAPEGRGRSCSGATSSRASAAGQHAREREGRGCLRSSGAARRCVGGPGPLALACPHGGAARPCVRGEDAAGARFRIARGEDTPTARACCCTGKEKPSHRATSGCCRSHRHGEKLPRP